MKYYRTVDTFYKTDGKDWWIYKNDNSLYHKGWMLFVNKDTNRLLEEWVIRQMYPAIEVSEETVMAELMLELL